MVPVCYFLTPLIMAKKSSFYLNYFPSGDFSRGTRKKKQVQFESCTPEDEPLVPMIQKASKISFEDCLEVEGREEKEGEQQEEESGKDVEEKNEEMTETNGEC